jgi:geranylgeranylglycerol-phosphate geranylgeranyltransferase
VTAAKPAATDARRAAHRIGGAGARWLAATFASIRLMRVHACLTAALAALIAAGLAANPVPTTAIVLMMAVVFLVTGGGNALNDYYDRHIDRINASARPLPSGAVSERCALAFALGLFAAGVALSLALTPWCIGLAVVNTLVLIAYALRSKHWGLLKNLCVAYLVGSVFLFGALSPGNLTLLAALLAVCAGLATLAREIVKDIEDLAGDRSHGARTLPALLGVRCSYVVAYGALALAVLLALLPYALGRTGTVYLALVLVGGAVLLAAALRRDAAGAQRGIMAGSIIELSAFVLGGPAAERLL